MAVGDEIGNHASDMTLVDTREWHPHPANSLRAFNDYVMDRLAAGATRIHLAGDPVRPDGSSEFTREWSR